VENNSDIRCWNFLYGLSTDEKLERMLNWKTFVGVGEFSCWDGLRAYSIWVDFIGHTRI